MKSSIFFPFLVMVEAVVTSAETIRGLNEPKCSKFDKPEDLVPLSWNVLEILQSSQISALKCTGHIDPVEKKLRTTHVIVKKSGNVLNTVEVISDRVTKSVNKIFDSVNKASNLAQRIPKIGKLIKIGARIFGSISTATTKITKQIDTLKVGVDTLEKVLSKAVDGTELVKESFEKVATGMGHAAKVQDGVIRCVVSTKENCDDDKAVEVVSSTIQPKVAMGLQVIDLCDKSFSKAGDAINRVEEVLAKLKLEVLQKALEVLEAKLGPVIREFEKLVKAVLDKINEGYCCVTPFPLQKLGELASQVIDVVTCPIDGLFTEVEKSLATVAMLVSAEIHNMFLQQILPIVKLLHDLDSDLTFKFLMIDKYTIENACTLSPPTFSTKSYSLIDKDLLNSIPTKIESQGVVHFDIGSSILNACKESASALGKISKESCCVEFKGNLGNGMLCDPTGTLPYKHCSMCEGGENEFWWSKAHQACGKEPCMNDGVLCGLGTTCKRCCRKESYWFSKAMTACGQEPCWSKGAKCGEGTSCKRCCNGSTYKFPNLWSNCK